MKTWKQTHMACKLMTGRIRFWVQPPAFVQNNTSDVLEFISRSRFSNSQNHLISGTWTYVKIPFLGKR